MTQPQHSGMTLDDALRLALEHHSAQRFQQAEEIYRQILSIDPNHFNALQLLGQIALQFRRPDIAVDLIGRAISIRSDLAETHFNLGMALAQLNRVDEAIDSMHRAITLRQNYVDARINLGAMLQSKGLLDEAVAAYQRAVQFGPDSADAYYNLGTALRELGQVAEAANALREAVRLRPDHPQSLNNLGATLQALGREDEAIPLLQRALAVKADFPEAAVNLGDALQSKRMLDDAINLYQYALQLRPEMPEAFLGLGAALQLKGQPHQAIDVIRKLLAIRPDHPDALNNLGNPLGALDHLDDAAAAYRRALELRPEFAAARVGLGSILWRKGQVDEAIAEYDKALQSDPTSAEALSNLGTALLEQGNIEQAEECYRKSIQNNPNYALAHTNLGLLLLQRGDFEQGWREHEWRGKAIEVGKLAHDFPQPKWDGADLDGRSILIYAEQGFGDAIQFVRYVPQVVARGGRVILRCPGELRRLFGQIPGIERLVLNDDPLPGFDVQCSLLSLPMVIGTRLESIPGNVPYLRAEPYLLEQWEQRLRDEARLKVGLAWAGKKGHIHDRRRSMSLAELESLAALKDSVSFFSLQMGDPAAQAKDSPLEMIDWTGDLNDFADTAALIDRLDLVITVDTAIAHLAGAIGKRVWVLLQQMPDWRWMLDRSDSPWYPTMELFRQAKAGDWSAPVAQVSEGLRAIS